MFRLAIERSHMRVALVGLVFVMVFGTISAKLLMMAVFGDPPSQDHRVAAASSTAFRPDIVDRNGEILATDIRTVSGLRRARQHLRQGRGGELLTAVLPELNASELRAKLSSRKDKKGAGFVWVKRELTPKQQAEVTGSASRHRLPARPQAGLSERHRRRPHPGRDNLDGVGIAGIEKYIDSTGLQALNSFGLVSKQAALKPVQLSIDLRASSRCATSWPGASTTSRPRPRLDDPRRQDREVIALVSMPDFDPNDPKDALSPDRINRMNVGVYEMGSTFKAMTLAMALDSGKYNVNSTFDTAAAC